MKRGVGYGAIGGALWALVACGPEAGPIPDVDRSARGLVEANGEVLIVSGELGINLVEENDVFGTGLGGPANPNTRAGLLEEVAAALRNDDDLVDALDALVVFTTWPDRGNANGSTSLLLFNEIQGIGLPTPDDEDEPVADRRQEFGLQPGSALYRRMRNLVYFNEPSSFLEDGQTLDDLNEPEGDFHALVARRISDRWLFNARFAVGDEAPSEELLGRQEPGEIGFNWSNLADSEGSIQGGYDWVDEGDGSFTNQGTNLGFAPLDLYLMGFVGPQNVPDFFLIRGATQDGNAVGPDTEFEVGDSVSGNERLDLSIIDIIEGMGPRSRDGTLYQRVGFALLTFPGEPAEDYAEELDFLQELQSTFPESWQAWTGVSMCTRVTGTCPEPQLRAGDPIITDDNDDLVAPDETVQLDFEVTNNGIGTARGARIRFAVQANPDVTVSPSSVDLPEVAQDGTVTLPSPVDLTITSTACGESVEIRTVLELAEGPQVSQTHSILIGVEPVRFDPLDEAPDWTVNPDGLDSATAGEWALGVPEGIVGPAGIAVQPDLDASEANGSVLAFMTQPRDENIFTRSDVDGGKTTLLSPVFAIGDTRDPIVRVWVWRSAYDFTERDPVPVDTPLVIEVSNDGGQTWPYAREFTEQTVDWTPVDLRLRSEEIGVDPTDRMRFRFSITEEDRTHNIEAGVDDLEITDFLAGCPGTIEPEDPVDDEPDDGGGGEEDDGGGCTAAPQMPAWLLLAAVAAFARRRRV